MIASGDAVVKGSFCLRDTTTSRNVVLLRYARFGAAHDLIFFSLYWRCLEDLHFLHQYSRPSLLVIFLLKSVNRNSLPQRVQFFLPSSITLLLSGSASGMDRPHMEHFNIPGSHWSSTINPPQCLQFIPLLLSAFCLLPSIKCLQGHDPSAVIDDPCIDLLEFFLQPIGL